MLPCTFLPHDAIARMVSLPIEEILAHLRKKGIDPRAGPFADTAA
jgi:hypothetical protein